jgi:hypothetical protein
MKHFLYYWLPALILMLIIFAFSSKGKGALRVFGELDFVNYEKTRNCY